MDEQRMRETKERTSRETDKEEDYRKQPCNQGNGADTVLRPFVTNIRSSSHLIWSLSHLVTPRRGPASRDEMERV